MWYIKYYTVLVLEIKIFKNPLKLFISYFKNLKNRVDI